MMLEWLNQQPRGLIKLGANLSHRTWLKVGGKASVLFVPEDAEDLALILRQYPKDAPLFCLGAGSNILIRDGGIDALVVQLGAGFNKITQLDEHRMQVGALVRSYQVAKKAAEFGLAGLGFLAGIPGSVGGALAMNAGAHGGETYDHLESLQWMDRAGNIQHLTRSELDYGYRYASLEGGVYLSAIFCCPNGQTADLQAEMAAVQKRREDTQPVGVSTGGSTFMNPTEKSPVTGEALHAWQWIDAAGCRGLKVGGAMISEKHCNFMINDGSAKARDFEVLAETVRDQVWQKFGLKLQWEIRRQGYHPEQDAVIRTIDAE